MRAGRKFSFAGVVLALATFVVTLGVSAVGGAPRAAAVDSTCGGVCFWQDYRFDPSQPAGHEYFAAGSKSDQTGTMFTQPHTVFLDGVSPDGGTFVLGSINNFINSHYTNKHHIDDSVSFVWNNTANCLVMYGVKDFVIPTIRFKEGIIFGPGAKKALAGATLGDTNDKFSSAAMIPGTAPECRDNVTPGNYTQIQTSLF